MFWLGSGAANLKNATPYNVQTSVNGEVFPLGDLPNDAKPGEIPPADPSVIGSPNDKTPATTGKVFFVASDGQPHWCSGSSVQTAYKNLVATAGHCVSDIQGAGVHDKWIFVPGYAEGATPWGLYIGNYAFTHYDWQAYTDYDRDYAFVNVFRGVVASASGGLTDVGRLGENVGAQGLAYTQPVDTSVDVFGYPAGSHPDGKESYTGETIESSSGKMFAAGVPSLPAEGVVGVHSNFTGAGSLGSSWLTRYSPDARTGYLNGITISVADTDGDQRYDTSISPYFDGELAAVYTAARSKWAGSIVAP